jgi:hypothetical protein
MFRGSRALPALATLALVACGHKSSPGTAPSASASAAAQAGAATATPSAAPVATLDAGAYDGPWLGAIVLQAPVMSDSEWDRKDAHVAVLGYLRWGEKVPVLPEPHKKPNCPEGWYELLAGGFVCGRYATVDLDHPKFKGAPTPDLAGPLPYIYGSNVANGTPLYRSVPSRKERLRLEPWLVRKPKPKAPESDDPYALAAALVSVPDAGASDPPSDDDTPWWQKESPDGGPPDVTLEDLEENEGPIARRMVKGFILSLDKQFPANGTMWWKTVGGLTAPIERIFVTKPATDFHGLWLGRDDSTYATKNNPSRRIDKLPIAFILNGHARKWAMDDARKHVNPLEGELDHFQAVGLTGEHAYVGGVTEFWETDEGWWLRGTDVTRTDPDPPPPGLGEHEKWIDVNLKKQTLVAFEGTTPVYATIFSSGRNEHETVTGSFRIREKHIATKMHGDADIASDGPYSIDDVPYIEYFSGSYALHGAFWHAAFGYVKSHGCVNLAPWDSKNIFGWTEPQLPEGWHAILATKDRPGTRVIVHGKGPGTCQGPKMDVCEKNEKNERAARK